MNPHVDASSSTSAWHRPLRDLPPGTQLEAELTAYLKATTAGNLTSLCDHKGRLVEFVASYPTPQRFFELAVPEQVAAVRAGVGVPRHFRKLCAFLWFQDYARPCLELLWCIRFQAARADTKRLLATEFEAFGGMAARIGYSAATIETLEVRVIELFLTTGARQLADLAFADLATVYARLDKTLSPERATADVQPFAQGVKEAVRWSLRGVSKVLMALGLPGFDQPLAQHYARDPISLETYFAPLTNPFIRDSLLEYCRHMQTIRRPGTVDVYRRALLDFALYIQSQFPQLTSYAELRRIPHITSWLQHLHEECTDNALAVSRAGHPRPPITVEGRRKRILYVAAFLRRLALWEHPNAPTRVLFDQDDVPSHEEPLPFALEEWQAQRIIEAARTSTNLLGKVATLLLLRTGMRVGELLLLEVNSFVRRRDAASGKDVTWIRVPIIKLGQGREVPLAFDDAQQAVAEWNAHRPFLPPTPHPRSGQLVTFWLAGGKGYGSPGAPITYSAVLNAVDAVVEEAGLNASEIWPHRYRHTLGTLLINQPQVKEETVSTLLGHGPNRTMTARYAKIKNRTLLKDMEQLHTTLNEVFIEEELPLTEDGLRVESARLRELRLAAERAWRDQGYCYCTRAPNTFCVAEESCLKCPLAAFTPDHLPTLTRMAADAEGKGQVKRLTLIVEAVQKAQQKRDDTIIPLLP